MILFVFLYYKFYIILYITSLNAEEADMSGEEKERVVGFLFCCGDFGCAFGVITTDPSGSADDTSSDDQKVNPLPPVEAEEEDDW